MRFVKPLDEQRVLEAARAHDLLVTVEDNVVAGGAGGAVAECLAHHDMAIRLLQLGLPDRFQSHGSREELLVDAGLDADSMEAAIRKRLGPQACASAAGGVISDKIGKV